jgi:flagellar assembly factor FliW
MTTMTAAPARVRFIEPLPGFADDEFTLEPIDERALLYSLRSVADPELRFVLAAAPAFFPGYRPDLPTSLAGPLGAEDVDLLLVLTIGNGLRDATANLRAPVVLAPATGRAVQVILDDEDLSMWAPLVGD